MFSFCLPHMTDGSVASSFSFLENSESSGKCFSLCVYVRERSRTPREAEERRGEEGGWGGLPPSLILVTSHPPRHHFAACQRCCTAATAADSQLSG